MLKREENNTGEAMSDAELVKRFRAGDQTAFQLLAGRYFLVIRNRAAAFYGRGMEAEDLFQEGLLGLHRAACTYREDGEASFGTYAGVCIRNRLVSVLRSAQAAKNRLDREHCSIEEAQEVPSSPESEPENAVISKEAFENLERFFRENLSPTEAAVLALYREGKTYEQIAQALGMTKKSCDNAMQRIRKKLRGRQ